MRETFETKNIFVNFSIRFMVEPYQSNVGILICYLEYPKNLKEADSTYMFGMYDKEKKQIFNNV